MYSEIMQSAIVGRSHRCYSSSG